MRMTTFARLMKIVVPRTAASVLTITQDSRLIEDLKLDSMDRYDIACEILEEFGVDLADDKMMGARTVSDVVKLVDDALAALPVRGMA